ncbi:class I SAM-dependent methyltransferase [Candidatus Uabimicrobium sp. HlEnr_7]|uniref:class I SAM-dependent methyltransferase n=1 Tax=Candidatus Uabimicrobium helgolandensis TaxID=3095367 RepID=UPI003555C7F3
MDIVEHNRKAWNSYSKNGNRWSIPVTSEETQSARNGNWNIILTPNKNVPREWFGDIAGKKILCLASGGGQQAPILAAAGADVTSFDNSEEQLQKDQLVAKRDSLLIKCVRGDMADLSVFENESFDLIFHPVSNVFVENIAPVWKECFRVLKPQGRLLSGFMNPFFFLFDYQEMEKTGEMIVKHSLPYSDIKSLEKERMEELARNQSALEFGHTLEQQIGGQLKAGFVLSSLYEDDWSDEATPLNKYSTTFIATLAVK